MLVDPVAAFFAAEPLCEADERRAIARRRNAWLTESDPTAALSEDDERALSEAAR